MYNTMGYFMTKWSLQKVVQCPKQAKNADGTPIAVDNSKTYCPTLCLFKKILMTALKWNEPEEL